MREPTIESRGVKAWDISDRMDEIASAGNRPGNHPHTGVALWALYHPRAHPFWRHYMITVVSLDDVEGLPPANKTYPEADWELVVGAINPEYCKNFDPETHTKFMPMIPIDQHVQFHGLTKGQAIRVATGAASLAMAISPDQDFRSAWNREIGKLVEEMKKEV